MSTAGGYLKIAKGLVASLEEGKPHSSITDWVEVLSSDRYDELSLDGIPELVESINIQGHQGTTEAARAIRKKLKYGNVHRQLRALVILRALTENAGKGFKLNWANQELLERLKTMAGDTLLDPKVKKRVLLVFHAWSIQYKDEPRMATVARLYSQHTGGPSRRGSVAPGPTLTSPTSATSTKSSSAARGGFSEYDTLYSHDWQPAAGACGADIYPDLAAAKADADSRKRERENKIAMEQREAKIVRRERELKRKTDMAAVEARRQSEAAEEAERRRKMKEEMRNKPAAAAQPKRPKFDFQKEKPQIMVSVANALQCANNLVNSCRHLNREHENVTESPKVQDNLDKAKAARRTIIRYVQVVNDEEYVGTLLDANEKIVEAIQLYDKLSKPAALDSDSEHETEESRADAAQIRKLNERLQAQRIEADRTGELEKMQVQQKKESASRQRRQAQRQASYQKPAPVQTKASSRSGGHPYLQDVDFGSIRGSGGGGKLPPPMRPDSDDEYDQGTLSDFSDYDSSDPEYQVAHQSRSRRPSHAQPKSRNQSRRPSQSTSHANNASSGRGSKYASLDDDGEEGVYGRRGLLDPNDPFGDPFAGDDDSPVQERSRMQWREV